MSDLTSRIAELSPERRQLLLQRLQKEKSRSTRPPIVSQGREQFIFPLSFAQERMWFLYQWEPENPAYIIPLALRASGSLNIQAFIQSIQEIVRRHEVLRTRYTFIDEQPMQIIDPEALIECPVIDMRQLDMNKAQREEAIRALSLQAGQQPFQLQQEYPLRVLLLHLSDEEHVAMIAFHHIAADAWSTHLFLGELHMLYDAFSQGKPSPLSPLLIQYADFACWQRQWLQGEVLERALAYWREQLAELAPLDLPVDYPRPPIQSSHGVALPLQLSPALSEQLRLLSQRENVTLFMTLLAAFQLLLYRYTGQTDIAIGTPIANRGQSEIEGIIGFFLNTLVMRGNLAGNPTFIQLLKQIRGVALAAYEQQELPFEKIVSTLHPRRDISRSPLFQVMFSLQSMQQGSQASAVTHFQQVVIENQTTKFDLTLALTDTGHVIRGALEYNIDLFTSDTIHRLIQHYKTLLEGIVAQPECPVADLPLLSTEEQYHMLYQWNATNASYPDSDSLLHQLVEAQVARTPEADAVVFEQDVLSYRELDRRANQLAHYLRALAIGPEARVGICLERSLEMVVSILAVLKAGGAYVPLDPSYPNERLAYILRDAEVRVLLTTESIWSAKTVASSCMIISLDVPEQTARIQNQSEYSVDQQSTIDTIAYIIYTSGSTGLPKGVINTHRGVVNRLLWLQTQDPLYADDSVMQKTPFTFDISIWEFFWPLLSGARLIMTRPGGHQDTTYLCDIMQQQHITTIHFVPSMLRLFLSQLSLSTTPALRRVICSGEALPWDLQNTFFDQYGSEGPKLYNLYGPTEAAIEVSFWLCCHGQQKRHTVPIGHPIANNQLYILDARMRPVPIGVTGELYIGGVSLARGYQQQPALTAECFVPHPYSTDPGTRLYRTGDLARFWPDGTIEYRGRTDFQVKVRGFRIELAEIETALQQYPDIQESVVLAREDTPGEKRLVAYIVTSNHTSISISQVRKHLQEHLPEYMIPAVFVAMGTLPTTLNGKLDRAALPPPDSSRPDLDEVFTEARTETEAFLTSLWTRALSIKRIGIYDNFFDLGGDSLVSLRLVSWLNQAGLPVTLKYIFQYQTIAEFAVALDELRQQTPLTGPVALSSWQRQQLENASAATSYTNCTILQTHLSSRLELTWLNKAMHTLLRTHTTLRSRLRQSEEGYAQEIIGLSEEIPVTWVDLTTIPEELHEAAIADTIAALQEDLDVFAGPIIQVAYIDPGTPQPPLLVLLCHRLMIDQATTDILLRDLMTLCEQQMRANEPAVTTTSTPL